MNGPAASLIMGLLSGESGRADGVTMTTFAGLMGTSRQTVYVWKSKGLIDFLPDGTVNPITSCRRVDASMPRHNDDMTLDDADQLPGVEMVDPSLRGLSRAKLEHLQTMYKAEAARVALAVDKGELIPVDEAAAVFGRVLEPAISIIKNLPYRLGPRLVSQDNERAIIIALEGEINNAIRSVAAIDPLGVLTARSVSGTAD